MENNTKALLHETLEQENSALFKNIPHTDLHCHSILSAPFDALRNINPTAQLPPNIFERFGDFNTYLRNNVASAIHTIDDVRFMIRSAFQRLIEEGVIYTEMSFDLTVQDHLGIQLEEYLEMIQQERTRVADQLTVCAEAGLDRELDPKQLITLLRRSLEHVLFDSIDLYGDEYGRPIEDFIEIYQLAYDYGLKRKAHVGEFGTANDIRQAIEKLNLQVVQHGISVTQSDEVMDIIRERGISLNLCPQSNVALRVVPNIKEHPIRQLLDTNIRVTVNSDDYLIFGKSVGDQFIDLFKSDVCSEDEIAQLIDNGFKGIYIEKNE